MIGNCIYDKGYILIGEAVILCHLYKFIRGINKLKFNIYQL